MIHSMTAFASRTGARETMSWTWEMRGVNARGLDLRLRLPEGVEGLEPALRAKLTGGLRRGNVTLVLRLTREDSANALIVNETQLDDVLQMLGRVQDRALDLGVALLQPTAADVLNQKGVLTPSKDTDDNTALIAALTDDFDLLLADFIAMRQDEGRTLTAILAQQIDRIDALTTAGAAAAAERAPQVQANLTAALQRVMADIYDIEEPRIAQELALLAVKSDVTEEIDRLKSHVSAARALLDDAEPTGRKLDFLAQEFNREANTLCAKAQSAPLTALGLELKAVIEQMREQIQNVE